VGEKRARRGKNLSVLKFGEGSIWKSCFQSVRTDHTPALAENSGGPKLGKEKKVEEKKGAKGNLVRRLSNVKKVVNKENLNHNKRSKEEG